MKGKPTKWQQWQLDWLREHYADTNNAECCDALGIAYRTMRRMAAQLGLDKSAEYMAAAQAHTSACAAIANRGEGNRGKANLLKFGKAYRFRKGVTSLERLGEEREAERLRKVHATRNETIRKERIRIKWGLEQRTRMRLVTNRPQALARHELKKRGYLVPGRGAKEIYYNENTRRSSIAERRAGDLGISIYQQI